MPLTLTPPTTDPAADWLAAGEAWSHAALDWSYRFEPHSRDAVEAVFAACGVGAGTRLLDVACGSGYALGVAERRGAHGAGIDPSAGLLEIAARRAPEADLRVGSMFELPWDDESVDVVTSFNGIWGGCEAAIAEAHRVLRPGGRIGFTFWGPGRDLDLRDYFIVVGTTAPGADEELKGLAAIGAPGVAESMLEDAGFVVEERGDTVGILEACDDDDLWRVLRSAGAALPSLRHTGEEEVRRRTMEAVAPFRADDGSYRIVNRITHVVGRR